ncbi:hypothetical protein [Pseudomonas sp. NPDC087615]|uniref:hypothetical protein n=1 Tax=Pseudomonas sp. NPDC087615 TaxID=3364443 RepID=UPI00382A19C6
MLKKALLLVAVVLALPTQAAEPQTVSLTWTLVHNGKEVDGHTSAPVRLNGPYSYRNMMPNPYNKSSVHTGKKDEPVRGVVLSGVELSFTPYWANGVVVDYYILQSHLEGFSKLPGDLSVQVPNQRLYEARGTSQALAVGDTELIRLTCNVDTPVEKCPYYLTLTVSQMK